MEVTFRENNFLGNIFTNVSVGYIVTFIYIVEHFLRVIYVFLLAVLFIKKKKKKTTLGLPMRQALYQILST